jgi:NDP-sugar pyrophosphorylase family protein
MNRNPLTAKVGTNRRELLNMLSKGQLLAIPILDGARVVGLETFDGSQRVVTHHNPVFIMAGGFGKRLSPLTDNTPKPLLKVGEKPLLEIILNSFIKRGFNNFYISTHYLSEMITEYFGDGSRWGVSIQYVYEDRPLGTGGALGLLPSDLPDLPVIMCNGDILTTIDYERLLDFHNENNTDLTMCVRDYDHQVPYGVVNTDGNKIINIDEKPLQRFFVNAGIYVISPTLINGIERDTHIDMPDLIHQFISRESDARVFPIHEYWLDIGAMEDYKRAQVDILSLEF